MALNQAQWTPAFSIGFSPDSQLCHGGLRNGRCKHREWKRKRDLRFQRCQPTLTFEQDLFDLFRISQILIRNPPTTGPPDHLTTHPHTIGQQWPPDSASSVRGNLIFPGAARCATKMFLPRRRKRADWPQFPSKSPLDPQCVGKDHSHSCRDFTDTVTIQVKHKYFHVPRDILVTNSVFFSEELGHDKPYKFFLVLDDVNVELFNIYINVLFELSSVPDLRLRTTLSAKTWLATIEFLLRLWQLSFRLTSFGVRFLVEEALRTQYFEQFTAAKWQGTYVDFSADQIRALLSKLQRGYEFCINELIPFQHEFVTACAKCPGQVVATCFDHLDPGFRAEVIKSFALRVADPKVTEKKRKNERKSERKAPKKRRS